MAESPELRRRRRRTSLIRRRVVVASVLVFAIAWAVIFGQLALGQDPALAGKRANDSRAQVALAARERRSARRRHARAVRRARRRLARRQALIDGTSPAPANGTGAPQQATPPPAATPAPAPTPAPVVTSQS